MANPIPLPLGIVLVLVSLAAGGFLVFYAVKVWRATSAFVGQGQRATGRVVRLERGTFPGTTGAAFFPVVAFEANGVGHEFRGSAGSNPPRYREGQTVEVLHDPHDPAQAQIVGRRELYGNPLGAGVLGSLFLAAAAVIGFLMLFPPAAPFIRLVEAGDLAAVQARLQLDPGAIQDVAPRSGMTPLLQALGSNRCAIAELLVKSGAQLSAADKSGETPLHLASACEGMIALLLERGATVDARTREGRTPLHYAADRGGRQDEIVLLLSRGAESDARDAQQNTPLHLAGPFAAAALCRKGADITARNGAGATPAQRAQAEGDAALAEWLSPGGWCERLASQHAAGGASDAALAAAISDYYCTQMQAEAPDPSRPKRRPYQAGHCRALGFRLSSGDGVARDEARAARILALACDNGEARGCAQLARLNAAGRGVPRDVEQARQLYARACSGGDEPSCKQASADPGR